MDLYECSLVQIINNKNLNIKEIKELLEQLNNALKLMNKKNIIHRDIKPENILIKKSENNKYLYKLTDYGLSRELYESNKAEYYIKLKEKEARRYPKISNNKKRYDLDDEEEFEKESKEEENSVDEEYFLKKMMKNEGSCGH